MKRPVSFHRGSRLFIVLLTWWAAAMGAAAQPVGSAPSVLPFGWLASLLQSDAPWLWFLAAFLGGLALNLTPCVYPMIQVTLAFFSGQTTGGVLSRARLAFLYVLGMSLTYALLGLAAARTGMLLGSWLQNPAVLIAVALLITGLAMSMFGLYELRLPGWLAQRFGQASPGNLGALAMGLGVGLIAAPCIGQFVLSLLVLVGQRAQLWLGFGLFLTVGFGMGLPYIVLSVYGNRLARWPKAGPWLVWVKRLLGMVLIGLALYFVRPLVGPIAFGWALVGWLLFAGIYLGWIDRTPFAGRRVWIKRGVGLACAALALASVPASEVEKSLIAWEPYTAERFEQAQQQGRPVLVDVYADWCMPCVELDHVTFRNPLVAQRLGEFVALRIDATREVSPAAQGLLDRYGIYGVPTVLLFDAAGKERQDLRITGFVNPEELLRILVETVRRS